MVFEMLFRQLINSYRDNKFAGDLFCEIQGYYEGKGRYYHTLKHLDNLVAELLPIRDRISKWETVMFSVAYHDIIYQAGDSDNELKSAVLAGERLEQLGIPGTEISNCKAQILATSTHKRTLDPDTNFFLDADLSVLGYPRHAYKLYSELVRKEYQRIPLEWYNKGRRRFLKDLLQQHNIFITTYLEKNMRQPQEKTYLKNWNLSRQQTNGN
jgi:predicted metal-dependent HD superfamily phosphohydrolase